MNIPRADGLTVPLDELRRDVEAAKRKFSSIGYCFTYGTVESLLDKIEALQAKLDFVSPLFSQEDSAQLCNNATAMDMAIEHGLVGEAAIDKAMTITFAKG